MKVQEIARLYVQGARHLQAYIRWALGTAARPEGTRRRAGCRLHGVPAEEVAQQLGHRGPRGFTQNTTRST